MATTSIWAVKGWLGKVVLYIENPDKTDNPKFYRQEELTDVQTQSLSDVIDYAVRAEKTTVTPDDESAMVVRQFISGINCLPSTARDEMLAVKKRFGKEDGVIAYHGYQSFAPGEATPELAHEIGVKLAQRLWGERYQVLVATHLDKENHLHNHFVLNTVSFVDGIKYHRTEKDYHDMRTVSDTLCREYNLSVIQRPQAGKSKHYGEWRAEQEQRPTWRGLIRSEIDELIRQSVTEKQQWDIVQEVRQHKKRVPKHMDEPNIFSGLVFCADCGKPLVLHRASTMKRTEYNFKCYTYGKKGKTVCTPHHIREFELKAVVLEDLRRVTHFARMKEKQFAAYIGSKNTLELRREMNTIQKDLDTMRRRREELSKLFKRLYEDNVLGRVTDEQYRMLAGDYTVEQKALEEQIPEKEARLEKLKAASANVNTFVEKAKQYTAIDELTPELLRLFIQRIEVGERTEKYSRSSHQSIRIVYRDIGTVDSAMEQGEAQPHIAPPLSEVFQLPA